MKTEKSMAKTEKNKLQKMIAETQQQSYGMTLGRAKEMEEECKGNFAKLEDAAKNDACQVYFQNLRTLKMRGNASKSPFWDSESSSS